MIKHYCCDYDGNEDYSHAIAIIIVMFRTIFVCSRMMHLTFVLEHTDVVIIENAAIE
jgi:hypothetical protein